MISASTDQNDPYTGPALFHTGYVKTGTTFLQDAVFNNAELGFGLPGGDISRSLLTEWFNAGDGYRFDARLINDAMNDAEAPVRAAGLIPVWSEETLMGDPIQRRYIGPQALDRLAKLKRPLRFLVSIREQQAFALSAFREYLKRHSGSLTDFIGTDIQRLSYYPIFREDFAQFDIAIGRWQAVLGTENILVLPFEVLRDTPDLYFDKLATFVGLPSLPVVGEQKRNVGQKGLALRTSSFLNRFFIRSPLHQDMSFAARLSRRTVRLINQITPDSTHQRIEQSWKDQIADRYKNSFANSNRRLSKLIDIDLGKLGYACAPDDNQGD